MTGEITRVIVLPVGGIKEGPAAHRAGIKRRAARA
jgi:ATP-dependent Lon protease